MLGSTDQKIGLQHFGDWPYLRTACDGTLIGLQYWADHVTWEKNNIFMIILNIATHLPQQINTEKCRHRTGLHVFISETERVTSQGDTHIASFQKANTG
jgi:hypothetical protein